MSKSSTIQGTDLSEVFPLVKLEFAGKNITPGLKVKTWR